MVGISKSSAPAAAIFDMDGLLIDSEPFWREAEIACFAQVGVTLTESDCRRTMGWRLDEVIAYWARERPWLGLSQAAMKSRIIERVADLVARRGESKPGVSEAIALFKAQGMRLGLASSSPRRLIWAVLDRLQLRDQFQSVCSAEQERRGKPDPAVYLRAAMALGVVPEQCLALEDSVSGFLAAHRAGMRTIVVPDDPDTDRTRFAGADLIFDSLQALRAQHLRFSEAIPSCA